MNMQRMAGVSDALWIELMCGASWSHVRVVADKGSGLKSTLFSR
jgi:hypothetical protein